VITALVPGSFDPPTKGHLDVVERCASLFDEVIVAVVHNPSKTPLFTAVERVELLEECVAAWPNVNVASFEGLLVGIEGCDRFRVRDPDVPDEPSTVQRRGVALRCDETGVRVSILFTGKGSGSTRWIG